MDKKKIEMLCGRIIQAANNVEVHGEGNMAQLLGVCQAARNILVEISVPDVAEKEAESDG